MRIRKLIFLAVSTIGLTAQTGLAQEHKWPGIVGKVMDYLDSAYNKPVSNKPEFDLIGAPYYSSDSKFGVGIMASSLYNTNPDDSLARPSYSTLTFKATTASFFELTLEGEHIPVGDKYRLNYLVDGSWIDTRYWGIGYDMCSNDDNESRFNYLACHTELILARQLMRDFFIGPMLTFDVASAKSFDRPEVFGNMPLSTFNCGAGLSVRYDSRDNTTAPKQGVYLRLLTSANPSWLGNEYPVTVNELTACKYFPAWKGATIATRLHWRLTWGDTSWGMMSTLGGSEVMRGYYEGRYRDKCAADVCVELRQHIIGRSGIVLWGGAGSVFPSIGGLRMREVLPNYGIGYRWAFRKNVNVRADIGFGRGARGVFFNVNEAF